MMHIPRLEPPDMECQVDQRIFIINPDLLRGINYLFSSLSVVFTLRFHVFSSNRKLLVCRKFGQEIDSFFRTNYKQESKHVFFQVICLRN